MKMFKFDSIEVIRSWWSLDVKHLKVRYHLNYKIKIKEGLGGSNYCSLSILLSATYKVIFPQAVPCGVYVPFFATVSQLT